MTKELIGILIPQWPSKQVAEVVRPWPYQYLGPIIMYHILWVCFLMSMRSMKCGLNYRISSCNFVVDWTIVMGKMSMAWP